MLITDLKSPLKYGLHNKSFILNAPLVSCPIPVIPSGWVGAAANPPKGDDCNWATDQSCILNKGLVMKSIL